MYFTSGRSTSFITLALVAIQGITYVSAAPSAPAVVTSRSAALGDVDFYDPRERGGSWLNTVDRPLGEPLNVVISGRSSPEVLSKNGFLKYAKMFGMDAECLGLHDGDPQLSNLGDGNGPKGEREVLREHYSLPIIGTCLESLIGGNHLRTYVQNGPEANSGALFLAVSQQKSIFDKHDIVPDGYNIGRDRLVAAAYGRRTYNGTTFDTTVTELRGYMAPGADNVNHGIAVDGVVKLLTVRIV